MSIEAQIARSDESSRDERAHEMVLGTTPNGAPPRELGRYRNLLMWTRHVSLRPEPFCDSGRQHMSHERNSRSGCGLTVPGSKPEPAGNRNGRLEIVSWYYHEIVENPA